MSRKLSLCALGALAVGLSTQSAQAEAVNYGALEEAFGEPVTTSATGAPQKVSDVPMAMTIITADQIHHAAAVDIPGILGEYTDLDVWEWSNGVSDVGARGYDQAYSSRLLVLINGRQVYLDYRGFTDWAALPVQLAEIRQIEVVKGPNSALFGFNAAGGVINIVTYNPLYDKVDEVELRGGTQSTVAGSAVATGQIEKTLGVRLSAGYGRENAFDTSSSSSPFNINGSSANTYTTPPDTITNLNVSMDSLLQINDDTQAGLEYTHTTNHNQLIFGDDYRGYKTQTWTDSLKGSISANTGLGLIDAVVYHNWDHAAWTFYTYPRYDVVDGLTDAKVQDLFNVGSSHSFRVAAEYRESNINSIDVSGSQISYAVYSPSAMWNWQVTPQLDLTNAVRLDHLELSRTGSWPSATTALAAPTLTNADFNDRSFTKLSANSGAVYKLTDVDTLRASFGRGMQIPSLYEYALLQSATVAWKAGNPDLNPSVVTNYELGYTRDLPDYHTKVTTSLFYQTNDDLVSYPNFAASGATLKYVNVGNSDAWGWELGVDGKNGNWRWGGNYRLEYISDHLTVNSSGLAYPILYEGGAPHNLLTGRVGYTLDRWDFDLFGRYSTSYQMPVAREVGGLLYPVYTVPSYATLDARVAFNVTDKAWIAVSATNLQAEKTIYTSGPAVERQAFVTVGMKF